MGEKGQNLSMSVTYSELYEAKRNKIHIFRKVAE